MWVFYQLKLIRNASMPPSKHVLSVLVLQHSEVFACPLLAVLVLVEHAHTLISSHLPSSVLVCQELVTAWSFASFWFHRKLSQLWTRLGTQSISSVPSVEHFLDQKVPAIARRLPQYCKRGAWCVNWCLPPPLCRFPREGRKGVLQKGLLWHVCPEMRWLCPCYLGELHLRSEFTLAPWMLRLQSESPAPVCSQSDCKAITTEKKQLLTVFFPVSLCFVGVLHTFHKWQLLWPRRPALLRSPLPRAAWISVLRLPETHHWPLHHCHGQEVSSRAFCVCFLPEAA